MRGYFIVAGLLFPHTRAEWVKGASVYGKARFRWYVALQLWLMLYVSRRAAVSCLTSTQSKRSICNVCVCVCVCVWLEGYIWKKQSVMAGVRPQWHVTSSAKFGAAMEDWGCLDLCEYLLRRRVGPQYCRDVCKEYSSVWVQERGGVLHVTVGVRRSDGVCVDPGTHSQTC